MPKIAYKDWSPSQGSLKLVARAITVHRIALNMDQIEQYQPPPNPAKITDSRATAYIDEFGYQSWELDALDPQTLDALIEGVILDHLDREQWNTDHAAMERDRALLLACSNNWDDFRDWAHDMGFVHEPEGD